MLAPSDAALLDQVRRFRWPAQRLAAGGITGGHPARTRGQSQEFTDYRLYRPGDELARLDWKLLARTDRPYIRLAQDQTRLPTTLLLDASASLAYPSPELEKWVRAREVALGLAASAYQTGDPIGVVVVAGAGTRRLQPRTRRGVLHEIAAMLRAVVPGGGPDLAPSLLELKGSRRIAIISDFLGDAPDLLARAGALVAQGREVHAVHVVHPTELDPPRRETLLADPEVNGLRRTLTGETRIAYLERYGQWLADLARDWRLAGATYARVVTSEPVAQVVRRITRPATPR